MLAETSHLVLSLSGRGRVQGTSKLCILPEERASAMSLCKALPPSTAEGLSTFFMKHESHL